MDITPHPPRQRDSATALSLHHNSPRGPRSASNLLQDSQNWTTFCGGRAMSALSSTSGDSLRPRDTYRGTFMTLRWHKRCRKPLWDWGVIKEVFKHDASLTEQSDKGTPQPSLSSHKKGKGCPSPSIPWNRCAVQLSAHSSPPSSLPRNRRQTNFRFRDGHKWRRWVSVHPSCCHRHKVRGLCIHPQCRIYIPTQTDKTETFLAWRASHV